MSAKIKINKLGTKIAILITALAFISLSIVTAIFVRAEQSKIVDYHLSNGKTFAEFITPSIYNNYVSSPATGRLTFQDLVQSQLKKNPDIVSAMMLSRAGKIFFDTDDFKRGVVVGRTQSSEKYLTATTTLQMAQAESTAYRQVVLPDGSEGTEIVVPVAEASGSHIFSIRYLLSYASLRAQLVALYQQIGLILIPIIVFIILSSFVFASSITRPLGKLIGAVEEIQRGNSDVSISAPSHDEIGQLATAFNAMAKDVKKSHDDIVAYSKNIEIQVKERTQELGTKVTELERLNKLMVDRELKMIELKTENAELRAKTINNP